MATIADALRRGELSIFELPDHEPRCAIRPLYVTQSLLDWADDTSELHNTEIAERTLFEHLLDAFCGFRCDEPLHCGDFKRLMPTNKGIWKLHPAGLRIYGWVPARHSFAAVTGALEMDTKRDPNLNKAKLAETQTFIAACGLSHTILRGDFLELFPH